jgi:hypothetical protein
MVLNNRWHQPVVLFKCDLHRPAFPENYLKNKKPAGLFCASGLMSALY